MTRLIIPFTGLLLLFSCGHSGRETTVRRPHNDFRVQTFKVKTGWGYSIHIDGKEYIRQYYIPVVEGEIPFATSQEALKTGYYVAGKIKSRGNPSLSKEELKALQVLPATSGQQY